MSHKTTHFVLVHGIMHGAWCWYKLVHLLQQDDHRVTAIDLKSAGKDPAVADSINSFEEYNQPLMDFLADLPPEEKVVLVGHSFGGISLAYASEVFSHKIKVGVYVAGVMIRGGDRLEQELQSIQLDKEITDQCIYSFGNGTQELPTSAVIPKPLQKYLFYGTSRPLDVTLASLCLRPFPHNAMTNNCLKTTEENYGKVPRVYIKTEKDNALPHKTQDILIAASPPVEVHVFDCDHSPFFCQPDLLGRVLLDIATKYRRST